jgi:hypothetical protein
MKKLKGAITAVVPTFAIAGSIPMLMSELSTQVPLNRKKKKKKR